MEYATRHRGQSIDLIVLLTSVDTKHILARQGSEERTSPQTKRDDDEDLSGSSFFSHTATPTNSFFPDIKYLNYALVMEQLLYEYYLHGLRRFSEDDFTNAGFQDWVRGRFKEMAEHERTHKEFLESAIVAAGCDHVQPGDYDL